MGFTRGLCAGGPSSQGVQTGRVGTAGIRGRILVTADAISSTRYELFKLGAGAVDLTGKVTVDSWMRLVAPVLQGGSITIQYGERARRACRAGCSSVVGFMPRSTSLPVAELGCGSFDYDCFGCQAHTGNCSYCSNGHCAELGESCPWPAPNVQADCCEPPSLLLCSKHLLISLHFLAWLALRAAIPPLRLQSEITSDWTGVKVVRLLACLALQ